MSAKRKKTTALLRTAEIIKDNFEVLEPLEAQRVNFIIEKWGLGYRTSEICTEFCSHFGDARRTFFEYLEKAKKDVQNVLKEDRAEIISKAIARMDTITKRAVEEGNLKVAVEASRHKDNIMGLVRVGLPDGGGGAADPEAQAKQTAIFRKIIQDPKLRAAYDLLLEARLNEFSNQRR